MLGVSLRAARHNSSNARSVTAGKVGHNSSEYKEKHKLNSEQISDSASAVKNITKIGWAHSSGNFGLAKYARLEISFSILGFLLANFF